MPMQQARTPFSNMSWTPDVPSTALAATEYNDGLNVETDVRGIRSVAGDQTILNTVPGTPTYISGGFREDGNYWFIVATDEGYWWASKGGSWQNITPGGGPISGGYTQSTNITDTWNGTVPFFNDTQNPPMFWGNGDATMTFYSNLQPLTISDIVYVDSATQQIQLSSTLASAPYLAGDRIVISGTGSSYYDGTYVVVSSTTSTINYTASPGGAYPGNGGTVAPLYSWNYNSNWKSVTAGWMRLYSTPNVGSILVAGNLTAIDLNNNVLQYPVTVQWSQAFGLNQAPTTWTPTVTNVANQLEVPLRGPAIDAFPSGGQFFLCSYWDTVVFSPLNYATTTAPILGVRLFTSGRGLLSVNCWAIADDKVYGVDSKDIWVFDGTSFRGIGNQRVKNWFYDNLNQTYVLRVYMRTNTQKNQIELYFPDKTASNGVPNKMISYRYDLDIWNPPRDVSHATMAVESPVWSGTTPNYGTRTIVYAQGVTDQSLVQKDQGYSFLTGAISSRFRRDNIKILPNYSSQVMVHRILPETINIDSQGLPLTTASPGNVTITVEGAYAVGSAASNVTGINVPMDTTQPWAQVNQDNYRVNTVQITNVSSTNLWMCNAITWQYTQVEDTR